MNGINHIQNREGQIQNLQSEIHTIRSSWICRLFEICQKYARDNNIEFTNDNRRTLLLHNNNMETQLRLANENGQMEIYWL